MTNLPEKIVVPNITIIDQSVHHTHQVYPGPPTWLYRLSHLIIRPADDVGKKLGVDSSLIEIFPNLFLGAEGETPKVQAYFEDDPTQFGYAPRSRLIGGLLLDGTGRPEIDSIRIDATLAFLNNVLNLRASFGITDTIVNRPVES